MKKIIKFNWGFGILVTIILFMGGITSLVVFSMNRDVNLVTKHYYKKELKYQKQIDKQKRTIKLGKEVNVDYLGNRIKFSFPGITEDDAVNGDIYFYRPSDEKKDFKIPIKLDKSGNQNLATKNIIKGYWRVQISWKLNKDEFYTEKSLMIN